MRQSPFIVPCVAVDKVWHHHIFDMKQYQIDCMRIFCFVFLHNPRYNIPIEQYPSFQEPYYNKVLGSYQNIFGYNAPKTVWSEIAISGGGTWCSTCGGDIGNGPCWKCDQPSSHSTSNKVSRSNNSNQGCGCNNWCECCLISFM
eukprot:1000533_1